MSIQRLLITLVLVACAAGLLFPAIQIRTVDSKTREKAAVTGLSAALSQYKREYGDYPLGDNAATLRALFGENPRKIIFFEARPNEINSRGELIDRWGIPYRIEFANDDVPHVSSAGKNKKFDGDSRNSDDILSWK